MRLIFSTQPGEIALFTDRYRPPKKQNVQSFFQSLKEKEVQDVHLAEGDRLLTIELSNDLHLLFQLFGNRANLFLVEQNLIVDAFKNPEKVKGKPAPTPRKPKPGKAPPEDASAKKWMLHNENKLPRPLIQPLIDQYSLEHAAPDEIGRFTDEVRNELLSAGKFRVLADGTICPLSEYRLKADTLKTFDSVNDAIRHAYHLRSARRRFGNKLKKWKPSLERIRDKTRRTLTQLEDAEKALERAEMYEKYGHLLMTKAHETPRPDETRVEMNDLYEEDTQITIEIDPLLSFAENAQSYYDKSAGAKKRIDEAKKRKAESEHTLEIVENLLTSLDQANSLSDLEKWEKKHSSRLEKLGITRTHREEGPSVPFLRRSANGFEIWIGKNAKSNDRLTSAAHKEDIWMHARGTSGSHVVVRMNNRQDYPPRNVLIKAASWAAWYSKQRGAGLVPVIVTKKKYVSKPKGAPPGLVRVQREEVEMVKPKKPEHDS